MVFTKLLVMHPVVSKFIRIKLMGLFYLGIIVPFAQNHLTTAAFSCNEICWGGNKQADTAWYCRLHIEAFFER